MTINNAAQSFSLSLTYTFAQVSVTRASLAPTPAPQRAPAAPDSVTLSPEAAATAVPGGESAASNVEAPQAAPAPTETPAATTEPGKPPSRSARRADALLSALDADKDGSITEQEFTGGAMALLRRAGARHHHRRAHGEDHEGHGHHHSGRTGRLERKLERLFDRIDGDGDGGVSKDELTSALPRVTRGGHGKCEPRVECRPASAAAATTVTSVTVSIAVQHYTAIGQMQ